ncbi:uncharacterized protein LOC109850887 [Asparagus officinalis]|uniref:uncharacterized protein LOC109850887 n=1 Tax=Asparagus officinalis TaxID=4686 RepID=UPI00098E0053|nr:uncharacterized protein LOC109850887 [Asparagus officinalis]XP_020276564.1 uncharacterized protein LOC109850887 [Asparagus officinalis]
MLKRCRDIIGSLSDIFEEINENLEQWSYLHELLPCSKDDCVKDKNKYGHHESVAPLSFQNQVFEGPDTYIETDCRFFHSLFEKTLHSKIWWFFQNFGKLENFHTFSLKFNAHATYMWGPHNAVAIPDIEEIFSYTIL